MAQLNQQMEKQQKTQSMIQMGHYSVPKNQTNFPMETTNSSCSAMSRVSASEISGDIICKIEKAQKTMIGLLMITGLLFCGAAVLFATSMMALQASKMAKMDATVALKNALELQKATEATIEDRNKHTNEDFWNRCAVPKVGDLKTKSNRVWFRYYLKPWLRWYEHTLEEDSQIARTTTQPPAIETTTETEINTKEPENDGPQADERPRCGNTEVVAENEPPKLPEYPDLPIKVATDEVTTEKATTTPEPDLRGFERNDWQEQIKHAVDDTIAQMDEAKIKQQKESSVVGQIKRKKYGWLSNFLR